ncbi:hypothetical protein HDU87_003695, partial [Geranomyces variabilis]
MPTKGKHAKKHGKDLKQKHKQSDQAGIPFSDYRDTVERLIRRDRVNHAKKILETKTTPHVYEDFNMREFLKTASFVHPNTVNMTNKDVLRVYQADIRHGIEVDMEIPGDKIAVGLDAAGERIYVLCQISPNPQVNPMYTAHTKLASGVCNPSLKETWTPQILHESILTFMGSVAMRRITLFITLLFHLVDKRAFSIIVLVINEFVTEHRDIRDKPDGWCAIVCLGDFEGGKFCLPQLKTRIPFVPGDILFIRSCALEHMGQK